MDLNNKINIYNAKKVIIINIKVNITNIIKIINPNIINIIKMVISDIVNIKMEAIKT